jgi:hypothetical protein
MDLSWTATVRVLTFAAEGSHFHLVAMLVMNKYHSKMGAHGLGFGKISAQLVRGGVCADVVILWRTMEEPVPNTPPN